MFAEYPKSGHEIQGLFELLQKNQTIMVEEFQEKDTGKQINSFIPNHEKKFSVWRSDKSLAVTFCLDKTILRVRGT